MLWSYHLTIAAMLLLSSGVFAAARLGTPRRIVSPAVTVAAGGGGATLLLDESGLGSARLALGLSLLTTSYTSNYVRLRRSSDNKEADFGGTGTGDKWLTNDSVAANGSDGALDGQTISTFFSGTDGYVAKWYDQSGSTNSAIQATAASQPKLVSSGALITGSNGRPAIQFVASGTDYLTMSFTSPSAITHSVIVQTSSTATQWTYCGGGGAAGSKLAVSGTHKATMSRYAVGDVYGTTTVGANWVNLWAHSTGTGATQAFVRNGATDGTGSTSQAFNSNVTNVGRSGGGNEYLDGYMSELVIWPSAIAAATMQVGSTNQNVRFAIY